MSSDNPYQPPATTVEVIKQHIDDVWDFTDPNRLPAGRGWFWIAEGFRLFAKSPGIWIVNMIIFFIITAIIALLPVISIANYILGPIFTGGFMRGTHTLDNGGSYEVNHLFAGFSEQGSKLATLGALQLGIIILYTLALVILAFIFFGFAALLGQNGSGTDIDAILTSTAFIAVLPIVVISALFLGMAFWLSAQLVMLHDLEAFASIKMSFIGSWRNILPIVVFSIIMIIFMLIAIIPFGLGLLVMWPVFVAATYAAWKDIFTNAYPI